MDSELLVIPGDLISVKFDANNVVLGPGVCISKKDNESIIPTSAGILQLQEKKNQNYIYIESNNKRYIPSMGDYVVGTVTGVFGDYFKISLSNFQSSVILSTMAFPNASKKNRPNLKNGDLVYARVSSCFKDIDVEIECIDPTTGKDGGFGLLEGGYVFEVKLGYARWLFFDKQNPLLEILASKCKFEIAIGINGKIWLKTDDLKTTLACSTIIENCQFLKQQDFNTEINKVFKKLNI
ncbi:hypothetical protein PACTADRAFT_50326 [Pachysolen tannophilus NRRL Y-2460]|uniref:Ribosomal RNA-processing protein 40 n=1 Tax=Pachysolen tannophilus NRRL Y-2460 TaxID=669874 RepID=A0A1E4TVE3_PACTA|nr:hypothetical protein PACTADRAFT_50326 [Pachysolen tannophilus NRRL Y-2460]